MNALDTAQEFIERCRSALLLDELTGAFQTALGQLGFRYYACGAHVDPLNPRQAVMVLNYPKPWVEVYSERQLHCIDPVFLYANRALQPFFWDDAQFLARTSEMQRRMLGEATHHGIAHGYTIPIHAPPGTWLVRGSCSLVPDSTSLHVHCYLAAQLMGGYLFETAAHLLGLGAPPNACSQLTLRERECLALAAQGKGDWDIATLLGLKQSTVHNYVESAKRRFSVSTRVQAVMHAMASEQISIGEVIPLFGSRAAGPANRRV